ncbi:TPA: hypothetical protein ACH3X1_008145 [Trebouxia sp. C0004]
MLSVLRLQQAFNNMLQKHEAELTGSKATAGQTAAVKIIKSKVFWRDLDILTPIAKPFNQACNLPQNHGISLYVRPVKNMSDSFS